MVPDPLGLWPKKYQKPQIQAQFINLGLGNQTYIEVLGINLGLRPTEDKTYIIRFDILALL